MPAKFQRNTNNLAPHQVSLRLWEILCQDISLNIGMSLFNHTQKHITASFQINALAHKRRNSRASVSTRVTSPFGLTHDDVNSNTKGTRNAGLLSPLPPHFLNLQILCKYMHVMQIYACYANVYRAWEGGAYTWADALAPTWILQIAVEFCESRWDDNTQSQWSKSRLGIKHCMTACFP